MPGDLETRQAGSRLASPDRVSSERSTILSLIAIARMVVQLDERSKADPAAGHSQMDCAKAAFATNARLLLALTEGLENQNAQATSESSVTRPNETPCKNETR
ncbi:dehydrogenase E1 and transketolase domain-containing protein 1 [Colletotrichum sp. SAR 10_76]|nr:dehydrogenase E1 and transketolase domain-containing protein 1 [Colletotrichum sp. SAR 10_76]